MTFDPRKTEIRDEDLLLPPDATLGGCATAIASLAKDLDFLTNRANVDLRERLDRLTREEADLTANMGLLAPSIRAEVATPSQELAYLADAHRLKDVRLDMQDTGKALVMIGLDAVAPILVQYEDGGMVEEVDLLLAHK